jgi:hypothetical protein
MVLFIATAVRTSYPTHYHKLGLISYTAFNWLQRKDTEQWMVEMVMIA